MSNTMNFKQIAIDCGAIEIKFGLQNELATKYQFQLSQLEEFAKAILASEQEPIGEINSNGMAWFYSNELAPKYGDKLYLHPSQDKVDAERYRWLRDSKKSGEPTLPFIATYQGQFTRWSEDKADAIIDKAMDSEAK